MTCAVMLGTAGVVSAAGDTPSVDEQLKAMREMMQKQQQELNALKSQNDVTYGDRAAIERQRQFIIEVFRQEAEKLQAVPAWVSKLKIKGDVRYRHEFIKRNNLKDRNRQRVRARMGFFFKINDDADAVIQLASGVGAATSTNQTLTGVFGQKPIWMDMAYFDYHPSQVKGLHIIGGKMKNPFYRAGKSDLIWDGDVRPEGLAATYQTKVSDAVTMYFKAGGFYLTERNQAPTADSSLFGVQAYAKVDLPQVAKKSYVTTGFSYYDFSNVRNMLVAVLGNTAGAPGVLLARDYNIWNPFVEFGVPVYKRPLVVCLDLAKNVGARGGDTSLGWLIGATYGKCKAPGSWLVRYSYRDIETDAVFAALTDGDFAGGGSGGKGHEITFAYQVAKNVRAEATYNNNDRQVGANQGIYHRLQLDMVFKF